MEVSRLFSAMDISASGLAAQRKRMNTVAENLANAETTRTAEGGPYRRQQVALVADTPFQSQLDVQTAVHDKLLQGAKGHLAGSDHETERDAFAGVRAEITQDPSAFREVYDPDHPDADENGMVKIPNVDIVQEMTELISAARAYEANVTAFNASKNLMKKALEL